MMPQSLSVWPSHKHVHDKHFLLITSKKIVLESFRNIEKQNVLGQAVMWCQNAQACLTKKIQNVCQAMPARLAGALQCKITLYKVYAVQAEGLELAPSQPSFCTLLCGSDSVSLTGHSQPGVFGTTPCNSFI